MAVYTELQTADIEQLLQHYAVGELIATQGVSAGVTNTIYRITTTTGDYILTLLEHLSHTQCQPYCSLMEYLSQQDFPCPAIIRTKQQQLVHAGEKPLVLQQFIIGEHISEAESQHCQQIGATLATLHRVAHAFPLGLSNPRDRDWCISTAERLKPVLTPEQQQLVSASVSTDLPIRDCPRGVIHADLFMDNVLFHQQRVVAVIDYFYACRDAYVLDIATTINDWCWFDTFKPKNFQTLLSSYHQQRALTQLEQACLPWYLCQSACRFWLSRLDDWYRTDTTDFVTRKNPDVFEQRLNFYWQQQTLLAELIQATCAKTQG